MFVKFSRICLLLLCMGYTSFGLVTWETLKNDYYTLVLEEYLDYPSLLPRLFTNHSVRVTVDLNLASINSFDELLGFLEISGYLTIQWTETAVADRILQLNGTSGELKENETVLVPMSKIWTPPLLLVNSIKTTATVGDSTSAVRLRFQSGQCTWQPWLVVRGSCSPDVRYYPFDKQLCSFKFAAWGHTSSEIKLSNQNSEWTTNFLDENGEWEILSTSSTSYVSNNVPFVEFKIELERRPTYYVINLIAPVILLGVLNVFVFILPAESGERIGYSITCFLSYIVLLNTIMAFLPTTSAPLSYLSYYTFIMMIFSAAMSLGTIITMRIYVKNESDAVPAFLHYLLYAVACKCCTITPANRVTDIPPTAVSIWDMDENKVNFNESKFDHHESESKKSGGKVTWKTVAKVIDVLMFVGFLGGQIFYSVSFLLPIILA